MEPSLFKASKNIGFMSGLTDFSSDSMTCLKGIDTVKPQHGIWERCTENTQGEFNIFYRKILHKIAGFRRF
jgi:hypothetical protein